MNHKSLILSTVLLLGLLLGLAGAASADTAYVPLVADQAVDGARVEAQVRLVNRSTSQARRARSLLLPSMTDGTQRAARHSQLSVVPSDGFQNLNNLVKAGRSGFLEVTSGPQIEVWSRLIGTTPSGARHVGGFAPAIGPDDVFLPEAVAVLEGWKRVPDAMRTDLHLLNLADHKAVCTASLFRGDGTAVVEGVRLEVPPYSHRPIPDALAVAGVERGGGLSSAITCNRSFFPFLTRQDLGTGAVDMVHPSLQVASDSDDETPADPKPTNEPSSGSKVVFERPGVFHVPNKQKEMHTIQLPLQKGTTYSKLVVDMSFTHGGWHRDADLNHGIFWLNRHPRWGGNVFGYLNAYGPSKSLVKLTSNVGATRRHQMFKSTAGVRLQPGQTYKVHYEYEPGKNRSFAEIRTTGGQLVARMQLPTRGPIKVTDNGGFFIAFGHTRHAVGPEVPTYGWKYADLKIQFFR